MIKAPLVQSVHSVFLFGFALYFLAEAFGYSLPHVGLSKLDFTYHYSSVMVALLPTISVLGCVLGYLEFNHLLP